MGILPDFENLDPLLWKVAPGYDSHTVPGWLKNCSTGTLGLEILRRFRFKVTWDHRLNVE